MPCGSPPGSTGALTLLRDLVLCNDSELLAPDGDQTRWRPMGDPTEAALVVAAAKAGVPAESTRASFPRLDELPFDSETKRMVTVHGLDSGLDSGRRLVVCKGAPEVHGLPGVAIGAEPAGPGILRHPPRSPDESVLGGGLWRRVAWTGILITAVTLAVGWWSHHDGGPWQTMVFLTLGLAQLGVAVALRRWDGGLRPRFLDLAVAGAVLLQLAALFVPALRVLLGTESLDSTELAVAAIAAIAATLPGLAVAAIRALGRRRVVSM